MTATIGENYLDSRDIQDRIEELESLREDFQSENDLPDYQDQSDIGIPEGWTEEQSNLWQEWDNSDEGEELKLWYEFPTDDSGWKYGIYFIRANEFTDYCKEMVSDVGVLPADLPSYIENNIDWEGVADDLRVDYSEVDVDDYVYFYRS